MDSTPLLLISVGLIVMSIWLMFRSQSLLQETKKLKKEISELKNIGDLLRVTENTLDDVDNAVKTAKRVMDLRIRKMEEVVDRFEKLQHDSRKQAQNNRPTLVGDPLTLPAKVSREQEHHIDPDDEDRERIARRNRRIILMLEDDIPLDEISRETGASMREINLIHKFIK